MKKRIKIFLIIVFLWVILFGGLYIYLSIRAKPIITSQLERFLNRKVKIDEVSLSFPLNLEIKNLDIEDLLKTEYVFISPDIFRIFTGKITLNELKIYRPKFNFKREIKSQEKTPLLDKTEGEIRPLSLVSPERKPRIFLRKLILDKGYIKFSDNLIEPEGIVIVVKDLDLKIENLAVPASGEITQFSLRGVIPRQREENLGRLEASGWMDLYRKDMQANLTIEDIDGIYLFPYYLRHSRYLSPEKLGIERATSSFFSQIQSHRNDLIANCQLVLTDLVFKETLPEEKKEIIPQKIVLNFVTKTKMDSPRFRVEDIDMAIKAIKDELSAIQKNRERLKPEDFLKLPATVLEETIEETTEVSRVVIEGIKTIGSEIKKALEEAFKREKKE